MEIGGRILVLGLGTSGYAVAERFAKTRCGAGDTGVTVLDSGDTPALRERAEMLAALGADVRLGVREAVGEFDLVVASPGIPPASPLMRSAEALGAEVISEVELAFRLSSSPFIAVTGTNGKTTVTSMIGHLLEEAGVPVEVVGNIGQPVISVVDEAGPTSILATEVSSFQLALCRTFRPRVAVLLNITPDHIDWHGSMDAYAADKARIFANQGPGDTAVIVVDDPGAAAYVSAATRQGAHVVRVSLASLHPGGASLRDGVLSLDTPSGIVELLPAAELPVPGEHNLTNALSAAAAAVAMGAKPEDVARALRTFEPIAHRLQPIDWVAGVEYFDDSKATNPDAAIKALTAFEDRAVVVLLGGRNKDNPFDALAAEVDLRCKAAVVFGEAAGEIAGAFHGRRVPVTRTVRMAEAVAEAARLAEPGDVVLLSPACASFDEFDGYAARGDAFQAVVAGMREVRGR